MSRPLRVQYPGALYHVTQRGNEKRDIFKSDDQRRSFLDLLVGVNESCNWICHGYCLMTNHYHLVIETVDPTLSRGMRQLNGDYAQRFNQQEDRSGHLFQGRFKAFLIERDPYLLSTIRYTVNNPVRAGLVKHPKDWEWSSFNATAGLSSPHKALTINWVLSQFGHELAEAQAQYVAYVLEGVNEASPFVNAKHGILSSRQYVDYVRDVLAPFPIKEMKEIPRLERYPSRFPLEDMFHGVSGKQQRNEMIRIARHSGYGVNEIAHFLGLHPSSVSRLLQEKC